MSAQIDEDKRARPSHARRHKRSTGRAGQPSVPGAARVRMMMCTDGVVRNDPSPDAVRAALQAGGSVVWVDVQGDPIGELPRLSSLFQLPRPIVEALPDESARARLLESHKVFAMVVHEIGYDAATEDALEAKLDIVFGAGFLITLHREPLRWLDNLWAATYADRGEDGLMGRGVAYVMHRVLDTLVDTYFPVLDTLDDIIDALEEETTNSTSNDTQAKLFRLKRAVATLRRIISPQVELTNSLITRTGELIPAEVEPYFADVRDHTVRVFEILDSYRDLLSGLLDVYLTTVSNRLNMVMKQLTIIATIFMPITFITGVFGMNFGHSPQVEHDAGYNFWIVLLAMALITAGQVWYFRRKGWL